MPTRRRYVTFYCAAMMILRRRAPNKSRFSIHSDPSPRRAERAFSRATYIYVYCSIRPLELRCVQHPLGCCDSRKFVMRAVRSTRVGNMRGAVPPPCLPPLFRLVVTAVRAAVHALCCRNCRSRPPRRCRCRCRPLRLSRRLPRCRSRVCACAPPRMDLVHRPSKLKACLCLIEGPAL